MFEFNERTTGLLLALVVVTGALPAGSAAAATPQDVSTANKQDASAYSGTHVAFETNGDALVDYTVNEETVIESVAVQSKTDAQSSGVVDVGTDIGTVTSVDGDALSVDTRSDVHATVTAEGGAELTAHDNSRGVLVVRAHDEPQYVVANVSSGTEVESESDSRVVVTKADGTTGAFVVVGDGSVTVNEDGNVSAELGENGKLVFRSYPEGRTQQDKTQERLIADGKAAAEVYVMESTEAGGDLAVDVVQYSEDTSVEVTETTQGKVTMTAERSKSQGKVIIATVSEEVVGSADDTQVTVDGEAAARASSYSELESAANGGETSKFIVRQHSSAEASADVVVAVNHFSKRTVTVSDESGDGTDGTDNTDGTDGETTDGSQDGSGSDGTETARSDAPGFGPVVALVSLVALTALSVARRR